MGMEKKCNDMYAIPVLVSVRSSTNAARVTPGLCSIQYHTAVIECHNCNSLHLCGPQVQKLQGILKPMMLRRLKEDVEKKLAPKEETIIEVELTNIQKKYYRAILEKNFSFLAKGAGQANMPNLVNTMMELRKCCNHPYLIKGRMVPF